MLKNKIKLYYFSGTGNTRNLVNHFAEVLKSKEYNIEVERMENSLKVNLNEDETLGLAFPVAIQSTYPLVWDFINTLPEVKGVEVFMFDTMELFSGGLVGPIKKVLTSKGYNCIGAREFKMSSSINTKISKVEEGILKNKQALLDVEKYANDLIDGKTSWNRVPILSDLMRSISASRVPWISTSQKLSITEDCIKCEICIKNCPAKAMSLVNKRVEIDRNKCNVCMRCVSLCPKQAILMKGKRVYLS